MGKLKKIDVTCILIKAYSDILRVFNKAFLSYEIDAFSKYNIDGGVIFK